MTSIIEAAQTGSLDAEIAAVISNNPDAPAIEKAKNRGIKTYVIDHRGMSRQDHENAVLKILLPHNLDYVILAGYMRILSKTFLEPFADKAGYYRIINIHPSLLPLFPGTSGYEDAFASGAKSSGITIHLVDDQLDHGPIIAQETFPRLENDSLETFKSRGLALENKFYPKVLQSIALNGIKLPSQINVKQGNK
jgi:phosphoribosylglycinamide formyltransferase-1